LPFNVKASVLVFVVFNLIVPSLRTLAFIIAIVPLVEFTPGLFPFIEMAKEACPFSIFPLEPIGVRTSLLANILPLVTL